MRPVLFHLVAILVTIVLYCVIVPQARADLLSDKPLAVKLEDVGVRLLCVYACFLFVYYTVFRTRESDDMPAEGAYGGYAGDEPQDAPADGGAPDEAGIAAGKTAGERPPG